ncbi:flagellar biosynthesis anti-sigma factor FlgM [Vibrio ostreicida]|uniref:Negative regulator of flagellin synthesis n=1 Tax=Vibrio ostreicida TaxID=526588 RepID=A0ABT8BQP0_9VIBR|nr:flagellar biosynthesis anti-sigma factor FlgM [Vibrio ostreicida]MDN3609435.1 flagellar biosynthesis anti-sigma factor FlgM [Vibrio ostreicida]NPD08318.1 flagellar biosynthesis anti-sigma factor FlgM [Vibrio ostreicida]
MKVDKVAGGHVPQSSLEHSFKTPTPKPEVNPVSEAMVNTNTAALDSALAQMKSLPDVDMAKVEQVRNALANGELSLDTKALSQAVLQFHTGHE